MTDARERGNAYFAAHEYRTAIQWYTRSLEDQDESTTQSKNHWSCYSNRSAAYLQWAVAHEKNINDTTFARLVQSSIEDAKRCIELDPKRGKGYSRLGGAYFAQGHYQEAIAAYKQGRAVDPDNTALEESLATVRKKRLAQLFDEGEEGDQKAQELELQQQQDGPRTSRAVATASSSSSSSSSNKLLSSSSLSIIDFSLRDILFRFFRSICTHLLQLPSIRLALVFLVSGLVCQLQLHWPKLVVISLVLLVSLRSRRHWIGLGFFSQINKITWSVSTLPTLAYLFPIGLSLVGQTKFFHTLHQDLVLSAIVVVVSSIILVVWHHSFETTYATSRHRKQLKLVVHGLILCYWVLKLSLTNTNDNPNSSNPEAQHQLTRLVASAAFHAAGMFMEQSDVQWAIRSGLRQEIQVLTREARCQASCLDVMVLLGTMHWLVEYWNQPTTFSMTECLKMLHESFGQLQGQVSKHFCGEIAAFRKARLNTTSCGQRYDDESSTEGDYDLFVQHVSETFRSLSPPHRFVSIVLLWLRHCPTLVIFVGYCGSLGSVPWVMGPFLWLERHEWLHVLQVIHTCRPDDHSKSNSSNDDHNVQLLLHDSPVLLAVWTNGQSAVLCLERSVTLTKVLRGGSAVVRVAQELAALTSLTSSSTWDHHEPTTLWTSLSYGTEWMWNQFSSTRSDVQDT